MEKRRTVIEMAEKAIRHACSVSDEVEFSAEDALRTDMEYLVDVVEAALAAGATTINIPDTTGFAHPEHYGQAIAELFRRIPKLKSAIVSAHCHNDLGLAVANSLAGMQNGIRQVECTINGIGERAGNASLEEFVMALKIRSDFYKFTTDIKTEEIYATSQLVSQRTGMVVQPNKAIVGQNAFAHESGIHQDGMLKHRSTYEIMTPESVGVAKTKIFLGKHSGQHGLKARLSALGYTVTEEALRDLYPKFIGLAESRKEVSDEDLRFLMGDSGANPDEIYRLEMMSVSTGTVAPASATISLKKNGKMSQGSAFGNGPIDACFSAVDSILHLRPHLDRYQVRSVGSGLKAVGEATVTLRSGTLAYSGRGISTDIVEASLRAYLDACNQMLAFQASRKLQSSPMQEAAGDETSLAW